MFIVNPDERRSSPLTRRRHTVAAAATIAAFTATLAACGSSDDGTAANSGDAPAPTVTAASAVTDAAATPTSGLGGAQDSRCRTQPHGRAPAGTVAVHGEVVASGLETPWGIAWLPGESMLVSERNGRVRHVSSDGTVAPEPVVSVPATESSEGGLLGIATHPDVESNRTFYVYYTSTASDGAENVVERYTLSEDGSTATSAGIVLDGIPAAEFHSGGRLRFGPDGKLYIGTGDASTPELSPDLKSLAGKLLRINDDGSIPADNPDPTSAVWLSGIRNTQGFDWRPDGSITVTDHGPSGAPQEDGRTGHDEVTVANRGDDLGWPGVIGCATQNGAVTPSLTWTQAVPPGGAAIYTGTEIPEWTGDLFIGVLGLDPGIGHLHRVKLDDDGSATLDEAYFLNADYGRIRDVTMGPDDALYFTTSNCDGRGDCGDGDRIIRVRPGSETKSDMSTATTGTEVES